MKTYFSKVFYFLGDCVPFKYGSLTYPLYRKLMLISIYLDSNNIVWESESNKKEVRKDFIAKLIK